MAGPNTLTFTDAAFDQDVLRSDVPVLVDFWAEWCGPCRQIAPAIDALATEYAGKVKIGKLDVDSNGGTAMRYNVRGIPTLLLFKSGQVVEQRVGAVGKSELQKMIDGYIGATPGVQAAPPPVIPAATQKKTDTPVPVTAEKV